MKGIHISYEKIEDTAGQFGDWCDKHLRKIHRRALAFCARHPATPVMAAIFALLKQRYVRHNGTIICRCMRCTRVVKLW